MATKKSAVKDLTNGSPVKLILGFALPLLLGMLFQQFYSMVDTIIAVSYTHLDVYKRQRRCGACLRRDEPGAGNR